MSAAANALLHDILTLLPFKDETHSLKLHAQVDEAFPVTTDDEQDDSSEFLADH